jgi:hypothetical protein
MVRAWNIHTQFPRGWVGPRTWHHCVHTTSYQLSSEDKAARATSLSLTVMAPSLDKERALPSVWRRRNKRLVPNPRPCERTASSIPIDQMHGNLTIAALPTQIRTGNLSHAWQLLAKQSRSSALNNAAFRVSGGKAPHNLHLSTNYIEVIWGLPPPPPYPLGRRAPVVARRKVLLVPGIELRSFSPQPINELPRLTSNSKMTSKFTRIPRH